MEVKKRRSLVEEAWAKAAIQNLDLQVRAMSGGRGGFAQDQRNAEMAELHEHVSAPDDGTRKASECVGRLTGSIKWRRSRGEAGGSSSSLVLSLGSGECFASIKLNEVEMCKNEKGLNLVVVYLESETSDAYNFYTKPGDHKGSEMKAFLKVMENLPKNSLICLAVKEDASYRLSGAGKKVFETLLGLGLPSFRGAAAFVAYNDCSGKISVLESQSKKLGEGDVEFVFSVNTDELKSRNPAEKKQANKTQKQSSFQEAFQAKFAELLQSGLDPTTAAAEALNFVTKNSNSN